MANTESFDLLFQIHLHVFCFFCRSRHLSWLMWGRFKWAPSRPLGFERGKAEVSTQSDGNWLYFSLFTDVYLRAIVPKFHLEVCKMKKIENPQTLPDYRSGWTISKKNTLSSIRFLFYANGHEIGLAALTSVSRGPHNALFELRLKINKTINLTTEYLNEKNTYLRTVWYVICPIPCTANWIFWRFLLFSNISLISADKKMAEFTG